ncbi:PqiC family protein [Geothermobacter hydrogeniphilus]|uniref:ABC-type transport auxiliary lipoprotein component domain-containing protein n=1 Tax=Geothermobacter hydrogeniphilus TaxID=1969733 RepID=A0A1X0Y6A4_9BACT|nr:PqiC family protein [Geothermobacter hydrogeniphilus]ORJ60622.1 hypothetical protein B5V00_07240 [Geothermobacter hydrogeniphilus]
MRPLLFLLLLGLAGCVNVGQGTSPSRHYLIPSLADQVPQVPEPDAGAASLTIGPVTLPGYLDRPQLVRRNGDRIEPAPFDRWGGPLGEQLGRVVAENLERLTPRFLLVGNGNYRLTLNLQRLDAEARRIRLSLHWQLENRKGEQLARGRFDADDTLTDTSAEALVKGYGKLLEKFSRELARQLVGLAL